MSVVARAEITTRYAKSYRGARKKDRGRILDEVVAVTGWSRDNARRRLAAAAKQPPGAGRQVAARPRKQRAGRYSYDARLILARVWAASGGQCGKYLAASMLVQLDALQRHGELCLDGGGRLDPQGRYSPDLRAELLSMSPATIDRYLCQTSAAASASRSPDPAHFRGQSHTRHYGAHRRQASSSDVKTRPFCSNKIHSRRCAASGLPPHSWTIST